MIDWRCLTTNWQQLVDLSSATWRPKDFNLDIYATIPQQTSWTTNKTSYGLFGDLLSTKQTACKRQRWKQEWK